LRYQNRSKLKRSRLWVTARKGGSFPNHFEYTHRPWHRYEGRCFAFGYGFKYTPPPFSTRRPSNKSTRITNKIYVLWYDRPQWTTVGLTSAAALHNVAFHV